MMKYEIINWLREIYDDLAYIFSSQQYLNELIILQSEFPNIDMNSDIEFVEKTINCSQGLVRGA
ncbi:hypothetical protein [Paenibacillus sp. OSY-SE]|uniref:hypothetical protein n=1 Tax=Paenibacillus sp. OSY-SE TaxID=1196323 RepID=UPI0002EB5D75|nr:hypothetical protein [Paenibacillus sp. OSY-SE]